MEEGKKMDYRIAICDDRQEDREYVRQLTACWAQQRGNQVEMTEFCSAEQFLFSCPQPDFDLLLLDIEMGEMDGVSLAKQVRRTNELMQIVFITGYSDYITEGYEVAALHYLMKPVKEEKLFVVLDQGTDAGNIRGDGACAAVPGERFGGAAQLCHRPRKTGLHGEKKPERADGAAGRTFFPGGTFGGGQFERHQPGDPKRHLSDRRQKHPAAARRL